MPYHIQELTGITTEMLNDKGIPLELALNKTHEFIGDNFILGYNTSFDINFLFDAFEKIDKNFSNDYFDILQLARKIELDRPRHRLRDMCDYYSINKPSHRALDDCYKTKQVYDILLEKNEQSPAIWSSNNTRKNIKDFNSRVETIDETNPFFDKYICFTGKLIHFVNRTEAMQLIVDLGGIPQENVTKDTNYLVIGETDFISSVTNGLTSKMVKANNLKGKGQEIDILNEELFIDYISDYIHL